MQTYTSSTKLSGKTIAIMAANGFNEAQMAEVQRTILSQAGVTKVISLETGLISGVNVNGWGLNFPVDLAFGDVLSSDFDGVIVIDGDASLEKLTESAHVKRILNGAIDASIPVLLAGDASSVTSVIDTDVVVAEGDETSVSGVVYTGALNGETNSVLTQFVDTLSGAGVEIKQAA